MPLRVDRGPIKSLADNISQALLVVLVDKSVWAPMKGLAYVRQMSDRRQQALALAEVAPHLPTPLLRKALAAAQDIKDAHARALALVGLAPNLSETLQEALAAVEAIKDEHDRALVLFEAAPYLPMPPCGKRWRWHRSLRMSIAWHWC
jgi:hypothetical protein